MYLILLVTSFPAALWFQVSFPELTAICTFFLPLTVAMAWQVIPQLTLLLGSVLPPGCMGRQDQSCYSGLVGLQGWTL